MMCSPDDSNAGIASTGTIFYDGRCGLSHYAVAFLLKQNRSRDGFRFAPSQGPTFQSAVVTRQRSTLPDSMIVLTPDGMLLVRSNAWIYVLRELGGGWKVLASLMNAIPLFLRDVVYDFVARTRYLFFGYRDQLYPKLTTEQRKRFD